MLYPLQHSAFNCKINFLIVLIVFLILILIVFNCIIDISNSPSKTKENKLSGSLTCIQGALNSKKLHRELSEVHCCWAFWKFQNGNTLMPARKQSKGKY